VTRFFRAMNGSGNQDFRSAIPGGVLVGALLLSLLPRVASAAPGLSAADYDDVLCVTAQRLLVNAPDMPVRVQRGQGNGFHTIQMSVDEVQRELVVAMSTATVEAGGESYPASVACKMVNRDRVNDQLGLSLDGPRRSCRDMNEHTFQVAFAALSDAERERYLSQGRSLVFANDTVVPTGGEWLPALAETYIRPGDDQAYLQVSAPSVQVPWDANERGFFQGTHHCKLISLASLQRWLRQTAFAANAPLYPTGQHACLAPSALTSAVGSCVFYFAPASAMFCNDYSGSAWTEATAREACGQRHASREALQAAKNRYGGAGGIFSSLGCAARQDAPSIAGTCVFHCNEPDEVLWQVAGEADAMMNRACDLYLEAAP